MRSLLTLSLLRSAAVPGAGRTTSRRSRASPPIKVVDLDRKTPVALREGHRADPRQQVLVLPQRQRQGRQARPEHLRGADEGRQARHADRRPASRPRACSTSSAGQTEKPFMPPKGEEPLTPEELALIKLWIDQGAKPPTGTRETAEGHRQRAAGQRPAGARRRRQPRQVGRRRGRGNQIHVYDAGPGTYIRTPGRPEPEDGRQEAGQGRPPVAGRVAGLQPRRQDLASGSYPGGEALGRRRPASSKHTPHRLRRPRRRPGLLARQQAARHRRRRPDRGRRDQGLRRGHRQARHRHQERPQRHGLRRLLQPRRQDAGHLRRRQVRQGLEVPSGKFVKSFEGHTHHVLDVGWKADGKLLASGGADNIVKVWDFEKGEQVRTINAHSKQVTRLVFVGKTGSSLTCSGDTTVEVLERRQRRQHPQLQRRHRLPLRGRRQRRRRRRRDRRRGRRRPPVQRQQPGAGGQGAGAAGRRGAEEVTSPGRLAAVLGAALRTPPKTAAKRLCHFSSAVAGRTYNSASIRRGRPNLSLRPELLSQPSPATRRRVAPVCRLPALARPLR